ncbi:CYP716B1 protein [Hibiscus syriacus]|uniref:CYP716B1 protein n=1 Tax=Hibiscus syriacus TaxID=106335 RepID=A0A6A3CKC3_HIBSY|nr:CYP716B1 protein [Hibiscus syriacus]
MSEKCFKSRSHFRLFWAYHDCGRAGAIAAVAGAIGLIAGVAVADSGMEDAKEQKQVDENVAQETGNPVPPPSEEEDHERAYFDSADWALGKQSVDNPKDHFKPSVPNCSPHNNKHDIGRPCAPSDNEDEGSAQPGGGLPMNETALNLPIL